MYAQVPPRQNQPAPLHKVGLKQIVRFAVFVLSLPLALFLAAGSLNWPMGWAYVSLTTASVVFTRVLLIHQNPDLISERAGFAEAEGTKSWDRALAPLVGLVGPFLVCLVAGLNRRWNWPPQIPLALQLVALVVVLLGITLASWAMLANRFFSAVVRIQKERKHTVITRGPYRLVRHPGYAGGLLNDLAAPLALGSFWALIPALLTAAALVVRTALEDRTLRQELEGYEAFAQSTRYRLLPGIW